MQRGNIHLLLLLILAVPQSDAAGLLPSQDVERAVEERSQDLSPPANALEDRINDILRQMTVQEKVEQLLLANTRSRKIHGQ